MIYGWTVEYCLTMPAKQFFTMKKVGKKIKRQKTASFLAELVQIARVPEMQAKSVSDLYNFYSSQVDDVASRRSKLGMDPTDEGVQQIIASQFTSAFKLMRQFNGI